MQQVKSDIGESPADRISAWRIADRLVPAIFSESEPGYRWAGLSLLALFGGLALAFVFLGAPPVGGGPWDTLSFLNAGWRIVNGQAPHSGFHDPIGPLTYLLVAFGMKAGAPTTASITYGSVLFCALLLPIAWYLAASRFSWFLTSLFVFFEGFNLITPRPPGYGIRFTSYAMIYNRLGYGMLALLCLCVFLKRREPSKRSEFLEGMLAGAMLGLLLYCKVTYFLAGAALFAVGVLLEPKSRRWLLASAAAFAGVCVAFRVLFHISLLAYFNDVVAAGHAQSSAMRFSLLSQGLLTNAMWVYLLAFCLVLCSWAQDRAAPHDSPTLRLWLVAGSIVAASLWILSGNAAQGGGLEDPMYFLAAVILVELFRRQNGKTVMQPHSKAHWACGACLVLLVPVFSFPILACEAASCGYVVAWDLLIRPHFDPSRRIHSVNLRDFYATDLIKNTAYWSVDDFPAELNDGIDLLRANVRPGDGVTTVAYVDPFSVALGMPPADDGPRWWDLNISFNRTHAPSAEEFLGHVSLVMVPRLTNRGEGCCFATVDQMLAIYGGYLQSHFHEAASTDAWILYRRNADSGGTAP